MLFDEGPAVLRSARSFRAALPPNFACFAEAATCVSATNRSSAVTWLGFYRALGNPPVTLHQAILRTAKVARSVVQALPGFCGLMAERHVRSLAGCF